MFLVFFGFLLGVSFVFVVCILYRCFLDEDMVLVCLLNGFQKFV